MARSLWANPHVKTTAVKIRNNDAKRAPYRQGVARNDNLDKSTRQSCDTEVALSALFRQMVHAVENKHSRKGCPNPNFSKLQPLDGKSGVKMKQKR